ncbi:mif2/CENP-C like domain-containing protein [Sarocladium implicatum]|nr:mif2/CENP-C like domain-containing protein [Sarocladium implicatum]
MAPRGAGRRSETASPQAYRQLGVQGRKTGLVLPDRGERDEYGMQPLDSIFSSPRKSPRQSSSARSNRTRDDSGSEDMDIASSAGPGPRTLLKNRNVQYPIPRSRSPVKTNLKSPARKNPHVDRGSSPDRDATVTRRIDFSAKSSGSKRGQAAKGALKNGLNGTLREDDEDEDDVELGDHPQTDDILEESLRMVEEMGAEYDDDVPAIDDDDDDDRVLAPRGGGSGRKQQQPRPVSRDPEPEDNSESESEDQDAELPPPRKVGRPPAKKTKAESLAKARASKKRRSLQEDESAGNEPKRQKTKAAQPKAAKGKAAATSKATGKVGRPKGRPKKAQQAEDDADAGDTSMAALQRGPPMPKARGLVSVHHDESGMKQTRSGRHSIRPLAFWRGETMIAEREDYDDMFQKDRHFVLPSIKEVVRVAPDVAPSKRAPRSKSRAKTKSKTAHAQEEDEELEEWEMKEGTVDGEVVIWEPEHELHPPAEDEPVHIAEEQIAISADAVQTRDIRDATFRFAKTLTMPFMGAGIVDLPPGAEKRPKNSRKMHMAFFVHYGKVMVTVNEAQFRISPGGTWFVPRGNYYSITNDYDNPARVFFAQACEVPAQPVDLGEE